MFFLYVIIENLVYYLQIKFLIRFVLHEKFMKKVPEMLLCLLLVELMVNDAWSILIEQSSSQLQLVDAFVVPLYLFLMFLPQQQFLHTGKLVVERPSP